MTNKDFVEQLGKQLHAVLSLYDCWHYEIGYHSYWFCLISRKENSVETVITFSESMGPERDLGASVIQFQYDLGQAHETSRKYFYARDPAFFANVAAELNRLCEFEPPIDPLWTDG